MKPLDVSIQDYDIDAFYHIGKYADACSDISAYALCTPDSAYSLNIFEEAYKINNTASSWGGSVKGVSLDCIGSVFTILVQSGMFNTPKGAIATPSGQGSRYSDLSKGNTNLHKRMATALIHFVSTAPKDGIVCIPVRNPSSVFAGDIYTPSYTTVYQGIVLPPHVFVFITPTKILTTNPASQKVEVIDIQDQHAAFSSETSKSITKNIIVWRCVDANHMTEAMLEAKKEFTAQVKKSTKNIPII